jgi:diaminopimelate decarboxylase
MYFFYPHRILCQDRASGDWKSLNEAKRSLLGRLCMEHDIVASNVELPHETRRSATFSFSVMQELTIGV